ncbi:MAG: nucleotide exchange factor GrpE, partial [Anaerolineae bacterium]|jgi:molecular chaperone GrpE
MQSLRQEGVETIDAQGEVFDPTWHEAIAAVPHEEAGVDQDTVAGVAQQGYRLDGRLLRPAQVVVAK